MKRHQYTKPKFITERFTINLDDVVTTSGGIIDNNTDVEIPDDFFGDGAEY